jgi:acylphosphatase
VRVRVAGRVQGVFFRESTRRRADELGLGGWVRNCPDGSVEAVFCGAADAVAAALAFIGHGPPMARVDSCDVREESAEAATGRFEVR